MEIRRNIIFYAVTDCFRIRAAGYALLPGEMHACAHFNMNMGVSDGFAYIVNDFVVEDF